MAKKKSKKQVKLIFDPESGVTHDPTERLQQATELLIQQGFKVKVALAKPKEVASKLARKAVRKGYRTVIAMGGDGTVEAVARELVGTKTRLGIIPAGTENNVAKCLAIPLDMESAVRLLAEGKPHKIDVGRVKVKKGKKTYFFELATAGILAALFPAGKDLNIGAWGQIGELLGQAATYPMPKIMLTLDNESHVEVKAYMVSVSNAPAFGKGFLLAPEAVLDDGLLDVNLYTDISKAGLVAFFAEVSDDKRFNNQRIERYRARKIEIEADPPQEVMADGLMLGKNSAKIRVCKHALSVILAKKPEPAKAYAKENKAAQHLPEPVAPAVKEQA